MALKRIPKQRSAAINKMMVSIMIGFYPDLPKGCLLHPVLSVSYQTHYYKGLHFCGKRERAADLKIKPFQNGNIFQYGVVGEAICSP